MSALYHIKSIIINLTPSAFKVVVIWLWITSYMTVARKKTPLDQLGFLLSLLTKELQHSSLKKKATQLPFVLEPTGVWTQKPCVLNGPVLLFGYWAGQCACPPPASQPIGTHRFPLSFPSLCPRGRTQARARASWTSETWPTHQRLRCPVSSQRSDTLHLRRSDHCSCSDTRLSRKLSFVFAHVHTKQY